MGTIYCMNCGIELNDDARFCPECGSPTMLGAGLVEPGGQAQVACPSCGALNNSTNKHCSECGAAMWQPKVDLRESTTSMRINHEREVYTTGESRQRTLFYGGIAAAALAVVVGTGFAVTGVLSNSDGEVQPVIPIGTPTQGESPQAGQIAPDGTVMGSAGTSIRDTLADYSWEELAIIGREMSRQPTRDAALAMAAEYHLVDEAGNMLDNTKNADIVGLGTLQMRVIDVYHDDLANGEGKAGLTFLATNIPFTHCMNEEDDITGGWESSNLRSWLNTTIYNSMSEDLRTSIAAVDKRTNNEGHSTSDTSVTSTVDYLWLPSMVELIGEIGWTWPSDPDNSDGYNSITNAEGSQYALFEQEGVEALAGNGVITLSGDNGSTTAWWERTCSPSGVARFRGVTDAGDPSEIFDASSDLGVCVGFCL